MPKVTTFFRDTIILVFITTSISIYILSLAFRLHLDDRDSTMEREPEECEIMTPTCILDKLRNRTNNDCTGIGASQQGRLGNQLFQISIAFNLAIKTNRCLVLDASSQLLQTFPNIIALKVANMANWVQKRDNLTIKPRIIWEKSSKDVMRYTQAYEEEVMAINRTVPLLMSGYFQSYKFFQENKGALFQMLQFSQHIKNSVQKRFVQWKITDTVGKRKQLLVGVHIRRGDMASTSSSNRGYKPASFEYLERAFNTVRKNFQMKNMTFLICSDTMSWVQKQAKRLEKAGVRFIYFEIATPAECLYALSCSDHLIISVGTFSLWAGYLNRGNNPRSMILYQKDFYNLQTPYGRIASNAQYVFPEDWTGL